MPNLLYSPGVELWELPVAEVDPTNLLIEDAHKLYSKGTSVLLSYDQGS
jgi:hypothetical protein